MEQFHPKKDEHSSEGGSQEKPTGNNLRCSEKRDHGREQRNGESHVDSTESAVRSIEELELCQAHADDGRVPGRHTED